MRTLSLKSIVTLEGENSGLLASPVLMDSPSANWSLLTRLDACSMCFDGSSINHGS